MYIANGNKKWNKLLSKTGVFLIMSLLAAGCGKTAAAETDKTESSSTAETIAETTSEQITEKSGEVKSGAETGFPEQMPAFTAKDLNGDTITEDIFSEKDLTVVNIWGTFCSPCVAEMPELGAWADSMPENVQLIGLIIDISGDEDTKHHDLAVTITEKADAKFTNIIANADFNSLLRWVVGVPTTLFVDRDGKLVGSPIIGADVEGYKSFVEDYLDGQ